MVLKFKFLSFLNSAELRELEKKLKAAYMNKERAAQIAEKDAIKYEQMVIMFLVIMFSIFLASFRKAKTAIFRKLLHSIKNLHCLISQVIL